MRASRSLHSLNLRQFRLTGDAGAQMAAALNKHRSLTALRLTKNLLEAPTLEAVVTGAVRLRVLSVDGNPSIGASKKAAADHPHELVSAASYGQAEPPPALEELGALVGMSPNLVELRLVNCGLSNEATPPILDGLRASALLQLPLRRLHLQSNKLGSGASTFGHDLAMALAGNSKLVELNVNNNCLDTHSMRTIEEAHAAVVRAWQRTDEGKQHEKEHGKLERKNRGGGGFLGDLMNAFS